MEKDVGERVIDKLNELDNLIENKLSQKKNSQLHLLIETDVLKKMKKKAKENNISLSEWCRKKLGENSQLDRIEAKLDKIVKK